MENPKKLGSLWGFEDPMSSERTAPGPSDETACSACGQRPRRKVDYGDFSEYEVRCLVAEYCMSVTLGNTGWGVPFKVWVELHGIARHDKMHRLIRLPNANCPSTGANGK